VAQGKPERPEHIRFVTYTPRYDGAFWIHVDALDRQYERAEIDAKQGAGEMTISTKNVARMELTLPGKVLVDGKSFRGGPVELEKMHGAWSVAGKTGLRKRHGLQGPIDDAFMDAFVCVRPTGKPMSAAADEYARRTLDRFMKEFAKYFRGDVLVKDDRSISDADIAQRNLIVFGDPGSNSVIARVLSKLPVRWTAESITVAGKKFSAAEYVPALIYPNPLNPSRYIVIDSGHTFGEADLKGTNALLYPRLGDYAVLKATDGSTAMAGLFDGAWKVE
jgi:hypothetical protein